MEKPLIITYGDGAVWTQQGVICKENEQVKCLTIKKLAKPMPINSQPTEYKTVTEQHEHDLILEFKNIEGARTLQDELNELIAQWSRELAPKLDFNQ
jgi:hypothetical protein